MRHRTLIRTLKILRRLESGGRVTLAELAAEHGCHPRTIRRDLLALESAGAIFQRQRNGNACTGWWLLYRWEAA